MNIVDQVVEFFSPERALLRMSHRSAIDQLRRYEAGSYSKRTGNWNPSRSDATTEVAGASPLLRSRARQMVRDNAWANRGARVIRTNVVGRGIKLNIDGKSAAAVDTLEKLWRSWAGTRDCDHYGRQDFYGIQRQIVQAKLVDGEVLVMRERLDDDSPVPFRLVVLEADYLAPEGLIAAGGTLTGNYIEHGIEYNRSGEVVAYHLHKSHPGSATRITTGLDIMRVPAEDILHIFSAERPGQGRGASGMASAMIRLRDLDDYEDAQIMRQKVASCYSVFIHDQPGGRATNQVSGYPLERLEPGMIERLGPGETISFADPPETTEYESFTRRILQAIAAAFGISYESLTNDYSNVNFSSGRMGWIEMQRNIEEWQDDIVIGQLGRGVWHWFVEAAVITGQISAASVPGLQVHWTPPRRHMIDPVKETEGVIAQIRARLITWRDAVQQMGYDPDAMLDQFKADQESFDERELVSASDPRYDANKANLAEGTQIKQSPNFSKPFANTNK